MRPSNKIEHEAGRRSGVDRATGETRDRPQAGARGQKLVSCFFFFFAETLLEASHTAASVKNLLLTCVERVAG